MIRLEQNQSYTTRYRILSIASTDSHYCQETVNTDMNILLKVMESSPSNPFVWQFPSNLVEIHVLLYNAQSFTEIKMIQIVRYRIRLRSLHKPFFHLSVQVSLPIYFYPLLPIIIRPIFPDFCTVLKAVSSMPNIP